MRDVRILVKYLFREHIIYNQFFTLLAAISLLQYGYRAFAAMFWLKVVGFVTVTVLWYWFRSRHLYFFYNLGFGWRKLLLTAWAVDTILSLVILLILNSLFP